jgi:hypothetical protein
MKYFKILKILTFTGICNFAILHPTLRVFCIYAGLAQLVEQLICNQQVGGSKPLASSMFRRSISRAGIQVAKGHRL